MVITANLIMKWFIVGGAGFIGSHFVDALLEDKTTTKVTIFDNFSNGRFWHYEHHYKNKYNPSFNKLNVIFGNASKLSYLKSSMQDHDVVIHLASNPDIAKATYCPDIDFNEGTVLTNNVLESMRICKVPRLLYASGSGVYGDLGDLEVSETTGPLYPVSTYGASKLAGESLICAYTHMFDLSACIFRFGNVVGPRQTHGVGFDFVRRLHNDPNNLRILGDGSQSKSYVYVKDVINAVLLANEKLTSRYEVYNVATLDYITVNEISDITIKSLNLSKDNIKFEYTGGNKGWKGDVPIIRLNSNKIRSLGWNNQYSSKESIEKSISDLYKEVLKGRI